MEKFILGFAAGAVCGAIVVANNCKVSALIKKNQEEVMRKAESYIDEKFEKSGCSCGTDETDM